MAATTAADDDVSQLYIIVPIIWRAPTAPAWAHVLHWVVAIVTNTLGTAAAATATATATDQQRFSVAASSCYCEHHFPNGAQPGTNTDANVDADAVHYAASEYVQLARSAAAATTADITTSTAVWRYAHGVWGYYTNSRALCRFHFSRSFSCICICIWIGAFEYAA